MCGTRCQIAKARKLPRPVTSRTIPLPCSARSNAVPVCGATLSRAASALGVSAGVRSAARRARRAGRAFVAA